MEQWRDIIGYEGYYQVSNLGRVRSLNRIVRHRYRPMKLKGKILQASPADQGGHLGVSLWKNGIQRTIYVHRLVARAWIAPPS